MVNFCAIFNCGNRSGRDKKSFYRLPAENSREGEKTLQLSCERRKKWLAVISRNIKTTSLPYTRVCSDHFISGKPSALYDSTNPDWVPSLKLGHDKVSVQVVECDSDRYNRAQARHVKRKRSDAAEALLQLDNIDPVAEDQQEEISGTATQTTLEGQSLSNMEQEVQRLFEENQKLKNQLATQHSQFDQEFFKDNDDKVKYYTGLISFAVLLSLFNYLEPFLPKMRPGSLSKFQSLVLTIMKMRLNLSHVDLGHRFGIARSTVSRIFLTVIDAMYINMKPFIAWPEREELRKTMPLCFRTYFGKAVVVIIDCFEVFLERPSNLGTRASTWSSYKHHNTSKYLIGITPQGVISYISVGWGGRVSDKHLVENSDFLRKLDPGDVVLADRGFNIDDTVALTGAIIQYPVFTRGKNQLSGVEVESTRRIANVRIHVERVIGSLRQKYSILSSTIPIDFVLSNSDDDVCTFDKIVVACCGLTNLCPSVVPFE